MVDVSTVCFHMLVRNWEILHLLHPAMRENPSSYLGVLITTKCRNILRLLSTEVVKHQSFGAVDFDIIWGGTAAWVIGIRTTNIGDLGDHVVGPVFTDIIYANILHAKAWISIPIRQLLLISSIVHNERRCY